MLWDPDAPRAASNFPEPFLAARESNPQSQQVSRKGCIMTIRDIQLRRYTVSTRKNFAEVVAAIDAQIGHPQMEGFRNAMTQARSSDELKSVVDSALGPAGLMEFTRFDFGEVLRKDHATAPRSLRIVAGNPMIMMEMVKHVPDAGSYAPITILVDEREGGVCVSYDLMESLLALYASSAASEVARGLDAKVKGVIDAAVGKAATA
jgi:uncharacterized protein (DUF302 family)